MGTDWSSAKRYPGDTFELDPGRKVFNAEVVSNVRYWDIVTQFLALADILPLLRPLQVSFTAYVIFSEFNIFIPLQLGQRAMVAFIPPVHVLPFNLPFSV
jgi:hypothetical protein